MNSVCILSCVGLLLAAAAAQYPKPCVSPALLTGGITLISTNNISLYGSITYDAYGQKVNVKSIVTSGNETYALEQLMLFQQGVFYDIDWQRFSCHKRKLDSSFTPLSVPANAKPQGQAILGSSSSFGMGVLVNNWHGSLPGNGSYHSVFTETGCIPMTYSGFGPGNRFTFISTYNWVLGIVNPAALHPPFICAKAQLEESETSHTFFTALESLAKQTSSSN